MSLIAKEVESPIGLLRLVTTSDGDVHRLFLPSEDASYAQFCNENDYSVRSARCSSVEALERYFGGDEMPVEISLMRRRLSRFQREVFFALECASSRGTTISYGELARLAGYPGAQQAVGRALATNEFPIFIPCHRVIKANGEPGGYLGGTQMKLALLEMESAKTRD